MSESRSFFLASKYTVQVSLIPLDCALHYLKLKSNRCVGERHIGIERIINEGCHSEKAQSGQWIHYFTFHCNRRQAMQFEKIDLHFPTRFYAKRILVTLFSVVFLLLFHVSQA